MGCIPRNTFIGLLPGDVLLSGLTMSAGFFCVQPVLMSAGSLSSKDHARQQPAGVQRTNNHSQEKSKKFAPIRPALHFLVLKDGRQLGYEGKHVLRNHGAHQFVKLSINAWPVQCNVSNMIDNKFFLSKERNAGACLAFPMAETRDEEVGNGNSCPLVPDIPNRQSAQKLLNKKGQEPLPLPLLAAVYCAF